MFLTCETACPLPLSRPQASRPISMPICIFNHKRDLFTPLIECFWHVRRLAPSPSRGRKQADQFQCLYVFLITNVTFSLAYVYIARSLQQQLLLNALKRNFALFKTVFKFLTSPHQNSIKKGRISFVWNSSSKIIFGKKVRLAYIIVYFFCPVKNNGCRLIMFYFLE